MTAKSRPEITIVNCQTNETIIREMNDEEFATYEKLQATDETTVI
jgi:hypothetical protein